MGIYDNETMKLLMTDYPNTYKRIVDKRLLLQEYKENLARHQKHMKEIDLLDCDDPKDLDYIP